jgi:hypothetical protein
MLVTGVAGFAAGHFSVAAAKAGGGDTKTKGMSCDDAIAVAGLAVAAGSVLSAVGENVLAGFCYGYATGS